MCKSSFEIQAVVFMSLESIWRDFWRVEYRKTSKGISQYFKTRHLILYLMLNSKLSPCRVKILKFKSDKKNENFSKGKNLHESLELRHF